MQIYFFEFLFTPLYGLPILTNNYTIIKNKMQDSVTIASDVYDTIANMATDDGGRYTTQLVDKLITKLKVQLEHSADGKMNVSSSDVKDMLKNINLG